VGLVVADGTVASAQPLSLREFTSAGAVAQTVFLPSDVDDVGRRATLSGLAVQQGKLALSGSATFLTFAALDANPNATVAAPFPYKVVRVSCAATVFQGPSFISTAATFAAASDTGLQGGNYIVADAAHTSLYAGAWGSTLSTVYVESAAVGSVAVTPVFTTTSYYMFQQTLAATTASAKNWGAGVFPTSSAQTAGASSAVSTTNGNVGYVAAAASAGGIAGMFTSGTGFFTLFWIETGVAGVYRSAQTAATPTWSVASSGGSAAFTSWATGTVAADATLVAVTYDSVGGILYAAGGTTLHKSCATPGSSSPCAFTSIATLSGSQRFRGLAMSPNGCGAVRRRAAAVSKEDHDVSARIVDDESRS